VGSRRGHLSGRQFTCGS